MHEMAIATELHEQVLRALLPYGEARVERVLVELGTLRLVAPEALDMAWRALTNDGPLAGARLELMEIPARARCRACGETFAAEVDRYVCPVCDQADAEIIEGNDIVLRSIDCETSEDAPAKGSDV